MCWIITRIIKKESFYQDISKNIYILQNCFSSFQSHLKRDAVQKWNRAKQCVEKKGNWSNTTSLILVFNLCLLRKEKPFRLINTKEYWQPSLNVCTGSVENLGASLLFVTLPKLVKWLILYSLSWWFLSFLVPPFSSQRKVSAFIPFVLYFGEQAFIESSALWRHLSISIH